MLSQKMVTLFVTGVLVLAGCETPEERVVRLVPAAELRCKAYGFDDGSDAQKSCIATEVRRLEDKEDAEAQAFVTGFEEAVSGPVTCYTSGYGRMATTTCY